MCRPEGTGAAPGRGMGTGGLWGFLELLKQRSTDPGALNGTDLLPGTSGGHKPKAGPTGLRARYQQGWVPFWGLQGESIPCLPGFWRRPRSPAHGPFLTALGPLLLPPSFPGRNSGCSGRARRQAVWPAGPGRPQQRGRLCSRVVSVDRRLGRPRPPCSCPRAPWRQVRAGTTGVRPRWLERAEAARERGPGPGGRGQELGWAVGQMDQRLPWWARPQRPEPGPGVLWLRKFSLTRREGRRPCGLVL